MLDKPVMMDLDAELPLAKGSVIITSLKWGKAKKNDGTFLEIFTVKQFDWL